MKSVSTLFFVHSILFTAAIHLECPPMQVNASTSQYELVSQLTHSCRYDSQMRPPSSDKPLVVQARLYVYYLQMMQNSKLQFKVQMFVQLRWVDDRLAYQHFTDYRELIGRLHLLHLIWFPHVFVSTEHDTTVMGLNFADQVVSILPHGEVILTTRLNTRLLCQTEAGKFPFDLQTCYLVMDNWRYNLTFITLQWEEPRPIVLRSATAGMTEFDLLSTLYTTSDKLSDAGVTNTVTMDCSSLSVEDDSCVNRSSLIVAFHFGRKFGFYFWDYYVPSVLLVVTSWGTFWVDPEVVPCRVWLATCTMLGFFGLGAMNDAMPKLSHLKMNDIWFIGCNLFIFLSLAEFAFVNIIHRQKTKQIPLKRASSKYILRSSLMSEETPWKDKCVSCPTSPELQRRPSPVPALDTMPRQQKSVAFDLRRASLDDVTRDVRLKHRLSQRRKAFVGTLMTNQQMANWIDRRSRVIFPVAFTVFNVIFWSLMFI